MAGKKRRKTSTGKSSGKRKTRTASKPSEEESLPIASPVLRYILDIASSTDRAKHVLKTLQSGNVWTEAKQVPLGTMVQVGATRGSTGGESVCDFDCYWIILATNLMNRFLAIKEPEEVNQNHHAVANYIIAMADALVTILHSDISVFKAKGMPGGSRSIVCKTIMTTALAIPYAIRNYDPQEQDQEEQNTYEIAVATLERLVHLRTGNAEGNFSSKGDGKQLTEGDEVALIGDWDISAMVAECEEVQEMIGSTKKNSEEDCVKLLLDTIKPKFSTAPSAEGEQASSPKRSTRKRKATSKQQTIEETEIRWRDPVPVATMFEKLETTEPCLELIDGKFTLLRWASIAMNWSHRGDGCNFLLRSIHELATNSAYSRLFSLLQKSRLMGTLVQIVVETGNYSGTRAPTGGLESYLIHVHGDMETKRKKSPRAVKSKRAKKSSKDAVAPKLTRGDTRDWTTVVIYDCIRNYKECLEEVKRDPSQNDPPNVFPSWNISELLPGLCRTSSSYVENANYCEQVSFQRAMMSIAAALALQVIADSSIPLDTKLIELALPQLTNSLRSIETQFNFGALWQGLTSSKDAESDDFETKLFLHDPLRVPVVPTSIAKTREKTESKTVEECFYGNVLSSSSNFTDEHTVALAIRAMASNEDKSEPTSNAERLFSLLLDLAKRVYQTCKYVSSDETAHPTKIGKRKRSSGSDRTTRRCTRRLKTESGHVQQTDAQENLIWNSISEEMAEIGVTVLNAIKMCLLSQQRRTACGVRKMMRKSITYDHMQDLIKLGEDLEKFIFQSGKQEFESQAMDDCDSPCSKTSDTRHRTPEQKLWIAHMQMCQVFGRGHSEYTAKSSMDSLIWDSDKRLNLYKALAAPLIESRAGTMKSKRILSLPASSRTILLANMTCATDLEDKRPEQHIVRVYVDSIKHALDHSEILSLPNGSGLEDEIPLSYGDARTFLVAVNALSHSDRQAWFDRLVSTTSDVLKSQRKKEKIVRNAAASGMLSRVLVVCYSLLNSLVGGKAVEQKIIDSAGSAKIDLPSLLATSIMFQRNSRFMSIFDSWQSPAVPDSVTQSTAGHSNLSKKSSSDFRGLLEIAFSMGFDSAPIDRCYLLFAAWNGIDQIPQEKTTTGNRSKFVRASIDIDNFPMKILDVHDSLIYTYEALNDGKRIDLKEMISSASDLVDFLFKQSLPQEETTNVQIPSALMVLLASLPTYIAALVAAHTNSGNGYFSNSISKAAKKQRRQRGYSTESDQPQSDCDDDEEYEDFDNDARADAWSRLHECCEAFGAAPTHPDWLDVSCSLRNGIRFSDATEAAETAMKALSRLASVAFIQYKYYQTRGLRVGNKKQKDIDNKATLCSTLFRWSRGTDDVHKSPKWENNIGTLTGVPTEVIDFVTKDLQAKELEETKSLWCPYAGQKLRGHIQEENNSMGEFVISNAELRAGGEWELLLAEALPLASLTSQHSSDDSVSNSTADRSETYAFVSRETRSEFAMSHLWYSIFMSATSHLVPVTALLRLGLGKVGRSPHPFAFKDNAQNPHDEVPLHLSEPLNRVESYPNSLKASTNETLALLARFAMEAEENLPEICHAAAMHLVVDTNSFLNLAGISSIQSAFRGLQHLSDVISSSQEDYTVVLPTIAGRLISIIEETGRGENLKLTSNRKKGSFPTYQRIHYCLGDAGTCLVDTITTNSIDAFKILKTRELPDLNLTSEISVPSKGSTICDLFSILFEGTMQSNDQTRAKVAAILSQVGLFEVRSIINSPTKKPFAILAMIRAFNKVGTDQIKAVVSKDLCGLQLASRSFRRDMASIFTLFLFSKSAVQLERAQLVYDALLTSLDSWMKLEVSHRNVTLGVLLTYGTFFNRLFEVGSKIVRQVWTSRGDQLRGGKTDLLSTLFSSLKKLRSASSMLEKTSSRTSKKASSPNLMKKDDQVDVSKLPGSCSFVQKSGFHEQHWYHCYTCNLTADKGCCTLCALVCHRGHDVAYSRYSSFFCDCAAEDGNATEHCRVSCKCLSSVPSDEIDQVHQNERVGGWLSTKLNYDDETDDEEKNFEEDVWSHVATYSFPDITRDALDRFVKELKDSKWLDMAFDVLKDEFKYWKCNEGDRMQIILNSESDRSCLDSAHVSRLSYKSARRQLSYRKTKPLDLRKFRGEELVAVREVIGFDAGYSEDDDSIYDFSRSVLAVDSRGRMIVAEPSSLIFCSPLAAINTRSAPQEPELVKSQICILGSESLPFEVVGIQLCEENESHVLVWGRSEAVVLILKNDFTGPENTIHLSIETGDQEREENFILNCDWLHGSQTHITMGCFRWLYFFDISSGDIDGNDVKRVHPESAFNVRFEANLRNLCVVPRKMAPSNKKIDEGSVRQCGSHASKVFVLLENGRLHSLDVKISNGNIQPLSDIEFETSRSVPISTEGIRPRVTSSIGLPGASTRTLGEGSHLAYLKQSRCLLYKCKSSAVVALKIDDAGDVEGTFEFLPHSIPLNIIGTESQFEDHESDELDCVSGPYTSWTEVGIVYEKGGWFFRVICVGKAMRSGSPKLLCIDFNDMITKVVEVQGSFDLRRIESFEGLTAFTAPIIHMDDSENRSFTGERSFLCALSSRGTLLMFGESVVDLMPTNLDQGGYVMPSNPMKCFEMSCIQSSPIGKFPLTIFEQLTNISDRKNLHLLANGVPYPKELKRLLSRESSTPFVSPQRNGCCITISLLENSEVDSQSTQGETENPELVISAVRILLGSNPDQMPSKISVQGRFIDVTPRLKKWYNIPFTEEEIVRGIRTGFISIWIGKSFESSNPPILDSVELYASKRQLFEPSIPKAYFPITNTTSTKKDAELHRGRCHGSLLEDENGPIPNDDRSFPRHLILGVRACSDLCELIGSTSRVSNEGKDLLGQLIQVAAVHPDKDLSRALNVLSGRIEPDQKSRWSFEDEYILIGCLQSLEECNALVNADASECSTWKAIRMILQECLKVCSLIARERPSNYLQSMGNLQDSNLKSGSIAIKASKLILEGLRKSKGFEDLIGGTRGVINLSLTEMAIIVYMDDTASTKDLTVLSLIRDFLNVANFSTCEAISMFFQDGDSDHSKLSIPNLFVQMEAARRVAYQCDGCGLCPMKEVRFTVLDEDYGIDLCRACFEVGKEFLSNHENKPSTEVVIHGKSMGPDLTCAHIKRMEPVSLEKMEMDVEQIEIRSQRNLLDEHDKKGESKNRREESMSECTQQDLYNDHRGYEYFLGELFSFVMQRLANTFMSQNRDKSAECLIKLILDLVMHSKLDSLKIERGLRFVALVSEGMLQTFEPCSKGNKLESDEISILVTCLRGLSSLMTSDSVFEFHFSWSNAETSSTPLVPSGETHNHDLVCDVHGIPAVRRRCDKPGANKGRRFYVCGKEKEERCDYFVWADERCQKKEHRIGKSRFSQIVEAAILRRESAESITLYDRLCAFLEFGLFETEGNADGVGVLASTGKEKKVNFRLHKSLCGTEQIQRDFKDGVFCGKEKTSDFNGRRQLAETSIAGTSTKSRPVGSSGNELASLLQASLQVLICIADHNTNGVSRWFSLLCEISMSSTKDGSLRSLASETLKTLCGGDRKRYHSIRDHFTFCFQLKRLYEFSFDILDSALIVKEKSMQCHVDRRSPIGDWSTLRLGDLIGTQDLIPEDSVTELNLKGCGKVVEDLWAIIKSRRESWRQFCRLQSLPLPQRQITDSKMMDSENVKELFDIAPIKVLFWIASSFSGIHQVKVLRMIYFAISDEEVLTKSNTVTRRDDPQSGASNEDQCSETKSFVTSQGEVLLMPSGTRLEVQELVALSIQMIRNGKTSEVRRISYQIVSKLIKCISNEDRFNFFKYIVGAMGDIGMLGKASVEFMSLLQTLVQSFARNASVASIADFVTNCYIEQVDAIRYDKSNTEWGTCEKITGMSVAKKKVDLSGCIFCLKSRHYHEMRDSNGKSERRNLSNSGRVNTRDSSDDVSGKTGVTASRQKWHPNQVSPVGRCRLDGKDTCTSNEFNLFYKLQYRISISEIHLTVSEPRGRFVKKITIYFTARPTDDALKSHDYSTKWQKIATLKLPKGGSRASARLSKPIVAANLRVEFTEFYQRPGNKEKGSDGSALLHCPRCTRPVKNAHGVCVTCGEVAFQCRKCRHINYERLDAFLCVECGYTSCGSFAIELDAAVASNAIAITDDKTFDKCVQMYRAVSSIHEDIKETLERKLRSMNQAKKKDPPDTEVLFTTSIERALFGLLPDDNATEDSKQNQNSDILVRFKKPGSVVKHLSNLDEGIEAIERSRRMGDRSERARSLLRLARQFRSESPSSDRRRSADVVIRHLGQGIAIENLDDENDLLEILESGSRGSSQKNERNSGNSSSKGAVKGDNDEYEKCQKMFSLLKEARMEAYELRRRMDAWNSLNSGSLVNVSPFDEATGVRPSFSPSHCAVCSGTVASHLLNLWEKLYLVAPDAIHIDEDFFAILFQSDYMASQCKGLKEIRKQVIISIATNSKRGAQMVLAELKKRLISSRDMNCAEILGKIMETEGFEMANEYAQLAIDILSSRR